MIDDGEQLLDQAGRVAEALRKREEMRGAYRRLFDSPEGKLVLADLARKGGLLETPLAMPLDQHGRACGPVDTALTMVNVGRRDMVVEILQELRWTVAEVQALAEQRTGEQVAAATGEGE